jgi:hypothetical protein
MDYLGVRPVAGTGGQNKLLAYPVRCYNAFYNNFIIDRELQTEISEDQTAVKYVNWGKDYFTTARTSPQLGTAVTISIGGDAPVDGLLYGSTNAFNQTVDKIDARDGSSYTTDDVSSSTLQGHTAYGNITADLSSATGMSIDDFKLAMAANNFQENRAKLGSRLVEYVKFLGGNIGDRLEQPEIISISSANVTISEVFNTNALASNLGDQAGFALAGLDSRRAVKWFPEHGYLSWYFWVIPETIYMDGCPRYFLRTDKEDFYTPEYANVMMQPVKKGEIYFQGTNTDHETFSYTDNYRDYKEGRNIFTSGS